MSLSNFEIGKKLGKGSFGSVCIVTRKKDNIQYAMKRVNLSHSPKTEIEAALNEIRLLASLNHPNIIGYKETFYDDPSGTLNIVMELADGGDLSKKIEYNKKKKLLFNENLIWEWIIQLLNGVLYLHEHQIMHRDLKSANIFLMKNGVLKIGDLNVSKLSKNNYARTKTGTPYYLAPEVWQDRPYDYKCDIWSIGCIIYELCCLVPPFRGTNFKGLYENIKRGDYQPINNYYSNDLKTIISKMLITDPNRRLSASELFNCNIVQNRMKNNSRKEIIEKISKSNQKYNLIGTIKMPRNLKDINRILPHENYQMEGNDPYETMKKTIKLMGNKEQNNDNNINNNVNIQPLNNYNRELANQKKQHQNYFNNNNNNNLIDNQNKNNNNNYINNNYINPNNIKPVIIANEQNNNNRRDYNIFNNNNNNNNPQNNLLNYNNRQNNDKIPVKEIKSNSKSKNSIKQGTNTRKRMEKEKFDNIKKEFNLNKQAIRNNKNQKPIKPNDNKPRRPPSGNPRNMNYNNKMIAPSNNNNNYNNNNNKNYNNNNNNNNINYINKNNINNNNNAKINYNKNQAQRRPLSHHNNRIEYNNVNINNNNNMKNNNYIKNNNVQNRNYPVRNNNSNNNRPVRKYEIKNHNYNYNGQNFDMKPYNKKNKANYGKIDVNKYKAENNKKFNNYVYNGGRMNNNNKQVNPKRQRVNPAAKQNNIHRNGKYY